MCASGGATEGTLAPYPWHPRPLLDHSLPWHPRAVVKGRWGGGGGAPCCARMGGGLRKVHRWQLRSDHWDWALAISRRQPEPEAEAAASGGCPPGDAGAVAAAARLPF